MSKNLTRKGLALGATLALGSTLFAGAPAFAASLTLAPNSGTGYTVLASDAFTLRVASSDYTLSSDSNLYWKVTQPSATASVAYDVSSGTDTPVAAISTSTVKYLDATATATTAAANTLKITPTIGATDASQDYIVQAFIESGLADGLDSNDTTVSSAVTVHFKKGADLTSSVTVDQISDGLAVTGTVKFSDADFNYAQSTLDNTHVLIKKNSSDFTTPTGDVAVTLNTDKNGFEFSVANGTAGVLVGDVIAAKSRIKGYGADATYTNSAVVYSTADAASNAAAADLTVTPGDNLRETTIGTAGTYAVRTGTKSFSYRVDFYKEVDLVNLVAAGKPVRVTIHEASTSLVTNDVVRVNGKKLAGGDGQDADAVLNTVTDAQGGITLNVESELGLVGDSITITALATGTGVSSANTFTWTDAKLDSVTLTNGQLGGAGGAGNYTPDYLTVVKGSTVTLKYALRDQFGKLWAPSGKDYRLAVAGSGGTLTLGTNVDFSAGEATLTYTDNSTAATTATSVVATLKSKASSATTYSSDLEVADTTTTLTSDPTTVSTGLNIVATAQAAAKITLGTAIDNANNVVSDADGVAHATNKVTKADKTLVAKDLRSNANGASIGNTKGAHLRGTAYNVDGSYAAGVPVTVSASGLYFSTNLAGSKYVVANSITINTDSDGTYDVWALSSKGGTQTITTTSGSVTKTQKIVWTAALPTDGTTITVTAPDSSLPGRSVDVVILLTDKYGAPVQTTTSGNERLSVALTGPGSNTTVAATTDADGKISFKLIFGSNDLGTAVVKVTYDRDGDTTTYSPVVVSKSIVVGAVVAAVKANVVGKTKAFSVSVSGNASAKNVVVKVAGKTVATLAGSASAKTYTVKATKGSKKVTVYVGGKLIATKTVSVK